MKKSDENALESIARNHFHDAQHIGTDGDCVSHIWSMYHQALVVIDGRDVETYKLADTTLSTFGDWTDHTEAKRGEWEELQVSSGGMVGMMDATVEVGA